MKPNFSIAAAVAMVFAGLACGRVGLDQLGDAGPGTQVDVAPEGPAPDMRPAGSDAPPPTPPFATILRVINVGVADFKLYGEPVSTCPYGFGIQGGAPVDQPTPLEEPAASCDCDTCGPTVNGPRCAVTDFLCQDSPVVLPSGAHFDFVWTGTVQVWLSPPPAGSHCAARCTAIVDVPAGDYLFTLAHDPSAYAVQSALPAPGGVVEIPVTAP